MPPKKLKTVQEYLPHEWSTDFLRAHIAHVQSVRRGTRPTPTIQVDYGTDGANPYGVGASSLTKEVRQWWYGRKGYPNNEGPPDYKFTAEQGRLMEVPVMFALQEMGYVMRPQAAVATKNYGGFVDNLSDWEGKPIVIESKHVNTFKYLEMWYKPLHTADEGYFWQAQAYLEGSKAASVLFVVTAQDASAVRAKLTEDKRFGGGKRPYWYDHANEPPPKVYGFRIYPVGAHKHMDQRALAMVGTLEKSTPPAREYDVWKDWHCREDFCPFRAQCLMDGDGKDPVYKLPDVEIKQVYLKAGGTKSDRERSNER